MGSSTSRYGFYKPANGERRWGSNVSNNFDTLDRVLPSRASIWGALGDNSADNSSAFESALDALQANGGGALLIPFGVYRYSTSPNWARPNVSVMCEPGTLLRHTGTGHAFIADGGTGFGLYGLRFENITVEGNSSSDNGFFIRSIHHSRFVHLACVGAKTTGAGFLIEANLCNTFDTPRCSTNEGTVSPLPLHGMVFTRKTAGGNVDSNANTILTPVMEGLTGFGGAGLYFDWANNNTITAGTSEGNYDGIHFTENAKNNVVIGTHFEANSHDDIYCEGSYNEFPAINAAGTVFLATGDARENVFTGGRINQLTLDTDAAYNKVIGITTGSSGGTLTDNGNHNVKFKNFDGVNGVFYPDSFTVYEQLVGPSVLDSNNPVTPPADQGNIFLLTWDNTFVGVAVTINAPSNPVANGQTITITVKNTTGGALGTLTWNAAYKMGAAWTQPANGFSRSITFYYDGTNWIEINRSAVDVSN